MELTAFINEIHNVLHRQEDLPPALEEALQTAVDRLGMAGGGIYLLDGNGKLHPVAQAGIMRKLHCNAGAMWQHISHWAAGTEEGIPEEMAARAPSHRQVEIPGPRGLSGAARGLISLPMVEVNQGDTRLLAVPLTTTGENGSNAASSPERLGLLVLASQDGPPDLTALAILSYQIAYRVREAHLKDMLRQAYHRASRIERLANVGQVMLSTAHEINNALTTILGYAQILASQESLDENSQKLLGRIVNEAQRTAQTFRHMMALATDEAEPTYRPVDLERLLDLVLDVCAYHIETLGIQTIRKVVNRPRILEGDPIQLQQVFVNLILNACQAMQESPTRILTITSTYHADRVVVKVQDTGPGVPPDLAERIFDLFFTTKPQGEGTGLGLAICRQIVEEHHGHIWVEPSVSPPGEGSAHQLNAEGKAKGDKDVAGAAFYVELPLQPPPLRCW